MAAYVSTFFTRGFILVDNVGDKITFVMANHLKLYLFGDQTYDIRVDFKKLLQRRDNPILKNFRVKSFGYPHTPRSSFLRCIKYLDL